VKLVLRQEFLQKFCPWWLPHSFQEGCAAGKHAERWRGWDGGEREEEAQRAIQGAPFTAPGYPLQAPDWLEVPGSYQASQCSHAYVGNACTS
jgi:hypothetical protein